MLHLKQKQKLTIFFHLLLMKCWLLFYTILKIDSLLAKLSADFNKDFKYSFVKGDSEMELKAFIELFLYRGFYKLNTMGICKLFSDSYGPPMFSAVMSCNRFVFILHSLSFEDESTRAERWKRTGLLRFVSFLKNSIISACWS